MVYTHGLLIILFGKNPSENVFNGQIACVKDYACWQCLFRSEPLYLFLVTGKNNFVISMRDWIIFSNTYPGLFLLFSLQFEIRFVASQYFLFFYISSVLYGYVVYTWYIGRCSSIKNITFFAFSHKNQSMLTKL